jgi:hypothetical protein
VKKTWTGGTPPPGHFFITTIVNGKGELKRDAIVNYFSNSRI